ncbi:PQQ-binding-like beta-propeller repeat protein [Kitasatospora sp. NPDC058190]|uniref:outer membrane protein assembly factor BamB family protein n=1 Tax=Kitasatospora sp. NPDC058190 TaxID=3346371 RepID=UPI0036DDBD28
MTGNQMAGDHPTPGAGEVPGNGPQENRGVSFGRPANGGVDPAAVADQMTQLDGSAVPGQAGPPAQPPAPPAQPPGGVDYAAYAPTAAGIPAQAPPPPGGAPIGPYDPVPGGYAAPDASQGYNVGGYNYQQQPGYTYPSAPLPAAPARRNPVMLWGGIIGGVLAIAIVIGLVVLLQPNDPKPDPGPGPGPVSSPVAHGPLDSPTVNSNSSNNPPGGGATFNVAWTAAKPATNNATNEMLAIWGTDKYAVRVDGDGIKAFNLSDGKDAWKIPTPAGSKQLCSASYTSNSKNIAAVSFNTGDSDCSTVGAVDLNQGKLLWTVKVSADKVYEPTLSITDNVVAVGGNVVGGLNINTGQPAWSYQPRDKDCSLRAKAAGNQIAVSDSCYSVSPKSQLVIVNADNGKPTSSPITLTGDIEEVGKVLDDKPLVLLMSNGPQGDYVLPFDKDNKPGNPMSVKEPGSDSLRLSGQNESFTLNAVSGTTLYVQVSPTNPAINAYDLTTGKRLWSANGGSDKGIRLVTGTDKNGKVRAIVEQGYDKPSRLVTLSQADGSMTDIGTLANPNGKFDLSTSTSVYYMTDDNTSVYSFPRYIGSDEGPVIKWRK